MCCLNFEVKKPILSVVIKHSQPDNVSGTQTEFCAFNSFHTFKFQPHQSFQVSWGLPYTIDVTIKKTLLSWGDILVSLRRWRLQDSKNAGH